MPPLRPKGWRWGPGVARKAGGDSDAADGWPDCDLCSDGCGAVADRAGPVWPMRNGWCSRLSRCCLGVESSLALDRALRWPGPTLGRLLWSWMIIRRLPSYLTVLQRNAPTDRFLGAAPLFWRGCAGAEGRCQRSVMTLFMCMAAFGAWDSAKVAVFAERSLAVAPDDAGSVAMKTLMQQMTRADARSADPKCAGLAFRYRLPQATSLGQSGLP